MTTGARPTLPVLRQSAGPRVHVHPAVSIFVECENEGELEEAFRRLADGGQVLMPLDNYGFSRRFAWVADRFGVSWQLNLE